MDQLEALRATLQTITDKGYPPGLDKDGPCSISHFIDLYHKARIGNFSEGKKGRWLGWIQGVLCARGILTVEECVEINKRFIK